MAADNNRGDDDEESTPPVVFRLAHQANRPLLAIVCDLLVDSLEHQRALKTIADAIRDSKAEVGAPVIMSLATEIRRDSTQRLSRADELDVLVLQMKAGE